MIEGEGEGSRGLGARGGERARAREGEGQGKGQGAVTTIPLPTTAAARRTRAKVTILLPARNEEDGVRQTLAALPLHELDGAGYDVEVVVVDGHSTDRTVEVAKAWGARVVTQEGRGKGMAVRTALRAVNGDYLIMIDSDHTYPEEAIPQFVRILENGADVVMGSRFRGFMEEGAMSRVNRVGNLALSGLASVLYQRRVTDVCTGMWGFRRRAVARLPLRSRAFELEAELFALSAKSGLRLVEVPIPYRRRVGETKLGKVRDGLSIGMMLLLALPRRVGPVAAAPLPRVRERRRGPFAVVE